MKNKKLRSLLISIGVILVLVLAALGIGFAVIKSLLAAGVVTQMDIDNTIKVGGKNLLPIPIVLAIIILLLVIFWNRSNKFNFILKWESFVVFLVTVLVSLSTMVFGPLEGLMNADNANSEVRKVSAATVNKSNRLAKQIAAEGTVLLKNEANFLPIKAKNINVFGWASSNPIYSGSGSGSTNAKGAVNIYDGLHQAGFKTNDQLLNFYTKYQKTRPVVQMMRADWTLPEPKTNQYSASLLNHAKKFSDTALVVISRPGGEGTDLPKDMSKLGMGQSYKNKGDWSKGQSYLELNKREKTMVSMVNKNFKNVIVLINAANTMELGWLNQYSHIKAALWMGAPSIKGFSNLGKILKGQVNPSGRTTDTYAYSLKSNPSYNNYGNFTYANVTSYDRNKAAYAHYTENIYVGYKWYETRYLNNEKAYKKAVQYAFGYGLSYTNFSQKMSYLRTDSTTGKISFDVTVKNTGKRAGKDVVQIYYTAPYYNGEIEKAATNLLDFAKTKNLKPGESQKIHFTFNREDMASYDEANGGAYVLDKGTYKIQVKNNSHDVIASRDYKLADKITYDKNNKRSSDQTAAVNQFQNAEQDGTGITYLSRKNNFANYKKATAAPSQKAVLKSSLIKTATIAKNYTNTLPTSGKMPVTGKKGNLTLADVRGLNYDSKKWSQLLDQMSVEDMVKLVAFGGYQTMPIQSVGKVGTLDFDGPAGFSSFFPSDKMNTTAFPGAVMIASTWNKSLADKRGEAMGKQGKEAHIYGWYGPAMNIHRSAFNGRNFEYYSEDGVLSGKIAAKEVSGAAKYGVYAYIKHFAMSNQETNRIYGVLTWSTEQAIRETYLKAFEQVVKTGKSHAVMTAFNFIGNRWCGANSALLNKVLRGEWGFRGLVNTDAYSVGFMNGTEAIANGNDMMLSTNGAMNSKVTDTKNPATVRALRTASHNILYTVANSAAYAKGNYKKGQSVLWDYQKTYKNYIITAAVVIALIQILGLVIFKKKYLTKN